MCAKGINTILLLKIFYIALFILTLFLLYKNLFTRTLKLRAYISSSKYFNFEGIVELVFPNAWSDRSILSSGKRSKINQHFKKILRTFLRAETRLRTFLFLFAF